MAEHLASIFGTEKDRVNCPFYFKIGACRHGDRCSRLHTKPTISPTLLLSNMYQRPDMSAPVVDPNQAQSLDPDKVQDHFENFYEDLFEELSKYGEIQSLNICDNLADHVVGNVYVQFKEEDHAANALMNLTGRFYSGATFSFSSFYSLVLVKNLGIFSCCRSCFIYLVLIKKN
ncbi:PREDICTED: splicing factor U2af small subunit B-like [Lupinus angustifolius]|uniref:splicing factor U2af small subunit B-like n=1 Tax=Lupinus angustifolius TaxID=3871 RepID=UPI00092F0239|nr:PREDICTED: splicing factor U2af small subunit B-like [Lupinus angustifolius]